MSVDPQGFDFFSREAPPSEAKPQCPKCSWHQPDGATSCAACGIIFAKYEAAERRRAAANAAAAADTDNNATDANVDIGAGSVASADDAPSWPSANSSAALPALALRHEATALEIAIVATRGAFSSVIGLTLMNVFPVIVMVVVAAAGGAALGMSRIGGGGMGTVALGVVAMVIAMRILAGITAGSLIMVDDVMRNGDSRGFVACFGDGFLRGGRALGVMVVSWLAIVACAMPAAAAVMTRNDKAALPLGFIGFVLVVIVGLRLSLALPAAILGQLDVVSAFQESVSLTKNNTGTVAVALLLSWIAAAVVGLCSIPFSWVPLFGLVLVVVVNSINSGILLGTLAGLWRERRAASGWTTTF
jgi:hypothetical protein